MMFLATKERQEPQGRIHWMSWQTERLPVLFLELDKVRLMGAMNWFSMAYKGLGLVALPSVDTLGLGITKTCTCEETGAKDSKRNNSPGMTFSISLVAELFRMNSSSSSFYLTMVETFVLALFYTLTTRDSSLKFD